MRRILTSTSHVESYGTPTYTHRQDSSSITSINSVCACHSFLGNRSYVAHSDTDNWQVRTKNQGAFASIMEYHVNGIDSGVVGNPTSNFTVSDKRPAILSGVAEAVYHLGWERNPNVVKLACFAPLIQNQHVWSEWC